MTKHKKEHNGFVFSKQIFCNADANVNANAVAAAEMSKQTFPNSPLILLEIGHLDQL